MISDTFLLFLLSFTFAAVTLQTAMTISADDPADPKPDRTKRAGYCAPKFHAIPGHSACLPGSDSSALSEEEQKIIVETHNNFRTKASPPASNMLRLRWDDEIAMVAQKWADNCMFKRDKERGIPGRFKVGQNIAFGQASFEHAILNWFDEMLNFTYGVGSSGGVIGHYTQLMWATTSLVGCGVQKCNSGKLYVCNYAPAGNIKEKLSTPWKAGPFCQDCKLHCFRSKLCDCRHTCLNEGILDVESCTCGCQYIYLEQTACSVNCTDIKDNSICATSDEAFCTYDGILCPLKCNICSGPRRPDTIKASSPQKTASNESRLLQSQLSACIWIIAWCRSLAYFLTSHTT